MTRFNEMTIAQLTAFWNANSASQIKKFSTKAEGVRRCEKLAATLKPAKAPRVTITNVCLTMIENGATNAEIWARLQEQFKLDDSKKHYPTWYRSYAKRRSA